MNWIILVMFGFLGGILGGMGMGGGTILIPLLTIFAGISQQNAQAINLISFLPMSIVALAIHSKNRLLNFKISLIVAISGIVSAIFGAVFASQTDSRQLSIYFGVFLILIGMFQLFSILIFKHKNI